MTKRCAAKSKDAARLDFELQLFSCLPRNNSNMSNNSNSNNSNHTNNNNNSNNSL